MCCVGEALFVPNDSELYLEQQKPKKQTNKKNSQSPLYCDREIDERFLL